MRLSIIIPFYNVQPYTDELLDCLEPQLSDDIEVIVVDDGSLLPFKTEHDWVKVIRQDNAGVSHARNVGLEASCGEYVAFIDADDLVASSYVRQIREQIPFDHLEMSWKSLPGGQQFQTKLSNQNDRLYNPSAVTRVFSRAIIGDTRFNEKKQAAEDAEFTNIVCKRSQKVAIVTDYLYFYRTSTPNSLTKRYLSGDTETKRIVYHYKHITEDMTYLLDEVKRENETNEVYILTDQNDIPQLSEYAKVMRPGKVRGMELRGEPWPQFTLIEPPLEVDVCIYTSQKHMSGIFTWIYSFCANMTDYDITVLHDGMDQSLIDKLIPIVDVRLNGEPIRCRTLIMMRIGDAIPSNIRYETSIQIVHSTDLSEQWTLPKDRDMLIPISKAVKDAWGLDHEPILNMTSKGAEKLRLISATRLSTPEKGQGRMRELVRMLKAAEIDYVWDVYSDKDPGIKGITYHPMTTEIRPLIRNADYLVQLSDNGEGFCYTIVEALEEGTAVITTPIDVLSEIGFTENKHGYIFGFNMTGDINRILDVPKVDYHYDNVPIKKKWGKVLGKGTNKNAPVKVKCIRAYKDMALGRSIAEGETLILNHRRAQEIVRATYGKII